jgi:hypothetical protein
MPARLVPQVVRLPRHVVEALLDGLDARHAVDCCLCGDEPADYVCPAAFRPLCAACAARCDLTHDHTPSPLAEAVHIARASIAD